MGEFITKDGLRLHYEEYGAGGRVVLSAMAGLFYPDGLQQALASAFRRDRLSHSYLLCGPAGSGKHTLARILAAAMQCTEGDRRPCGRCLACRKVFDGVHPDVVTVDDETHKGVGVEVIRRAREDLYLRPNEGRRKIYVLPRAMDMNLNAQNALLKILEEPPEYGAFLLLSDGPERLLPTIRSRCVPLQLSPLSEACCVAALRREFPDRPESELHAAWLRSGGYLGQAKELLQKAAALDERSERFAAAFAAGDRLALTELLVPMEKLKREQLSPLLREWIELLGSALSVRAGLPVPDPAAAALAGGRTAAELADALRRLRQSCELLDGNVSPGAVCGALHAAFTSDY